ncbi:hypothetical protein, partial [Mesorhizobium sp. M7A.F.Ca.CA.001.09.2.1]|uniref:hypothetical protein n=1 Tax=Mesorhizobium sp. M7A.F.Ca.CA.001.09.2.1 TaxID=2496719 RepID=UPI0019D023B8
IHFFTTSAGFCEKVVMFSALGSDLHKRRRFLLLGLAKGACPPPITKRRPLRAAASWRLIGEGGDRVKANEKVDIR